MNECTSPHALALVFCAREVLHSNVRQHVFAVKLVLVLPPTSWCGTSMSLPYDNMTGPGFGRRSTGTA